MPPSRPVIDFDHHRRDFADRGATILADLRQRCPVAWTEHHGGFWILSRYEDVVAASRDTDTFASGHDMDGTDPELAGVSIPPAPFRPIPLECDPPEFYRYRRALSPWFTATAIGAWEPRLRELTTEAIDAVLPKGHLDLVLDFANPIPARFTLELLGLCADDWQDYADAIHTWMYSPPGTPENARAQLGFGRLMVDIYDAVHQRRVEVRGDLLSGLVTAAPDGRTFTDDEVAMMAILVVFGGIDTTTGLFASAAHYLHRHPDLRAQLRDNPSLIPTACEEFLRFATPTQALARTVRHDVEVGGQLLKKGDRVLLCFASANHDEAAFDRAVEFRLDRAPNRHTSFGVGIHKCIGAPAARLEFVVMLEELLQRIPDYSVVENEAVRYEAVGIVNGWVKMPATFPLDEK